MHLSHIYEDLEAWYLNFDSRRARAHDVPPRPRRAARDADGPAGAGDVVHAGRGARATTARTASIGHSGVAPDGRRGSRGRHVGPDGTVYPEGTAIPQRADFNTLDNPFFWSADPAATVCGAAGGRRPLRRLQPDERRLPPRPLAMDGVLPDGTTLAVRARSTRAGLQRASCTTTHRQNFLVPPRATAVPALGDPVLTAPPRAAPGTISQTAEVAELVDAPDSKSGA